MADVYIFKQEVRLGKEQQIIFIGNPFEVVAGYGLITCPRGNDYFVLRQEDLPNVIKIIKNDNIKPKTVNEKIISPLIQEIENLETDKLTSKGLTREANNLLEILSN